MRCTSHFFMKCHGNQDIYLPRPYLLSILPCTFAQFILSASLLRIFAQYICSACLLYGIIFQLFSQILILPGLLAVIKVNRSAFPDTGARSPLSEPLTTLNPTNRSNNAMQSNLFLMFAFLLPQPILIKTDKESLQNKTKMAKLGENSKPCLPPPPLANPIWDPKLVFVLLIWASGTVKWILRPTCFPLTKFLVL